MPPHRPDDAPDLAEEILGACLQSPPVDVAAAVDAACARHPEIAGEIRERYELLRRLDALPRADAASEEPIPDRLGDFRLLRRLGGGGMGVVYLAVQESIGREVALKLVRPEHLYFPGARERFAREARAVGALQHPGIVPIHWVGEEGGVPYFAMDRIHGATFAEVLEELQGRAPESLTGEDLARALEVASGEPVARRTGSLFDRSWVDACATLAAEVADALEHAHARGIVHRDVKPSNVALTTEGRALLLDFGLTSSLGAERITRPGAPIGTLLYMPPEQLSRGVADVRSDVYSLGATLYECLSLQPPHRADDLLELQRWILAGRPDAIRPRNRRVPADLETVCLAAMELEPARRYASAEDFARDLRNALAHRPVEVRPPGVVERARSFVRRNRPLAVAIALALLLVTVLPTALLVAESLHAERLQRTLVVLRKEQERMEKTLDFLQALYEDVLPGADPTGRRSTRDFLVASARGLETDLADAPEMRASLQVMLGNALLGVSDAETAADVLAQALQVYEAVKGKRSALVATLLGRLGLAECRVGRFDEGVAHLEEAASIADEVLEPADRRMARIRIDLAAGLREAERLPEAIDAARRAVASARLLDPPDSALLASVLGTAGAVLQEQESTRDEAREWLRESVAIQEQRVGTASPNYAAALSNLALLRKRDGAFDEAVALYRRALDLDTRLLGPGSEGVAVVHANLAQALSSAGAYDEAEEPHRSARSILENLQGDEISPRLVECRGNFAGFLFDRRRWSEAEAALEEVVPQQRAVFGASSLVVGYGLAKLGQARLQQDRPGEAIEPLREARAILSSAGERNGLAWTLAALRDACFRLERRDEMREVVLALVDLERGVPALWESAASHCLLLAQLARDDEDRERWLEAAVERSNAHGDSAPALAGRFRLLVHRLAPPHAAESLREIDGLLDRAFAAFGAGHPVTQEIGAFCVQALRSRSETAAAEALAEQLRLGAASGGAVRR